MRDVVTEIYHELRDSVRAVNRRVDVIQVRYERAEVAGSVAIYALADAPSFADGARNGNVIFVSDGRKDGEGAAAGTGTMAYFNEATQQWFKFSNDTAVLT